MFKEKIQKLFSTYFFYGTPNIFCLQGKLSSEEVLRRIDTTEKVDGEIIQAVEEKLSELEDYYYFTRELQNQVHRISLVQYQ